MYSNGALVVPHHHQVQHDVLRMLPFVDYVDSKMAIAYGLCLINSALSREESYYP